MIAALGFDLGKHIFLGTKRHKSLYTGVKMNTAKKAFFFIAVAIGLTTYAAADSSNYVDHVQPYLGEYNGEFGGHDGMIRLSMVNNQLTAEFLHADGHELEADCEAAIGELDKIDVDKEDGQYKIDSATFEFNPGKCHRSIEGRQIHFDFKHSDMVLTGLNVSVLEYTETRFDRCYDYPGGSTGYPGYPGYPGYGYCDSTSYAHYITGKFTKL